MKRYSILLTAVALLAAITVTTTPAWAAFPGTNGYIVVGSDRSGLNKHRIWQQNPDGTDTKLTLGTYDGAPAWSPDGTRIAFVSKRDVGGGREIYVMNADGSGQTRLTSNPAIDTNPQWSPDGTRIVFNSDRLDSNHEIYVMKADGSEPPTRLTYNPADDAGPSWSPDGTLIAFNSNRDGNTEIYVMKADGTEQTNLTNDPVSDAYDDAAPDWSPDGSLIAFGSTRSGNGDIYVMDADGSNKTRLTYDPVSDAAADSDPAWSPDGTKIAFHSWPSYYADIYVIDADGSNRTQLTKTTYHDYSPSWQPIPLAGDLPEGIVSYWKFDEPSGTFAFDSAGSNYGDILGATRTTGQVNGALNFDGVDDRVDVEEENGISGYGDFTMSVWFKQNLSGGQQFVFHTALGQIYLPTDDNNNIVFLVFEYRDGNLTTGQYSWDFRSVFTNKIVQDEWYFAVLTADDNGTSNYDDDECKAYLNGELLGDLVWDFSGMGNETVNYTTIGAYKRTYNQSTDYYSHFSGVIDEVAVFDRALTLEEIQQHYQNGLNGLGYEEAPHNTPSGEDVDVVAVDPNTGEPGPVTLTFDDVTEPGDSTVTTSDTKPQGPPIPTTLKLGSPPTYFDIQTTAGYDLLITVGIDYSEIAFHNENNLKLMQMTDAGWVDITTSVDTINKIIYGATSGLSWFTILENNEPPIAEVSVSSYLEEVGSVFTFDGSASADPDGDVVDYEWTFGDDAIGSGVSVPHSYEAAGLYDVVLTVTDDTGAMSSDNVLVVVYDPSAGFATGGGRFIPGSSNSDPGDWLPEIDNESPASFGFVVKYKPGATNPSGQLEFQYRQGDFNLHSSSMDWLVIVNSNWAKFQGTAAIKDYEGVYPFRVDARDGDYGGGSQPDRFIIKVYAPGADPDNVDPIYKASGDLIGGSIVIHAKK